jgi:hypothetical protein
MKKGTYGEKPKNPEWLNADDAISYFQMSRLTLFKYADKYGARVKVGRINKINVTRMNEGLLAEAVTTN